MFLLCIRTFFHLLAVHYHRTVLVLCNRVAAVFWDLVTTHLSDASHHLVLHHHRLIVLSVERRFLRRFHQIVRRSLHSVSCSLRKHTTHTRTEN